MIEALQAGKPGAHRPGPRGRARRRCATCSPLTGKPVLFVANVDEGDDAVPASSPTTPPPTGAAAVAVSSRVEAELSDLETTRRPR